MYVQLTQAVADARRGADDQGLAPPPDAFRGKCPCARRPTDAECGNGHELESGHSMVEAMGGIGAGGMAAVLVAGDARAQPGAGGDPFALLHRHFLRKHGPTAFYGQESPVR